MNKDERKEVDDALDRLRKKNEFTCIKCATWIASVGDGLHDTCTKQSEELDLKFENHVVHLLVHACLHLLGFNHQKDTDFQKMKELEIKCLETCGIENPYAL